jgi:hypothetical protein
MTACADVFIQNLAPGAAARLGFGAKMISQNQPSQTLPIAAKCNVSSKTLGRVMDLIH